LKIIQTYKFGEVCFADLNFRVETEAGKTILVIIAQSQILLDANHPSTIIFPLTTKLIDNVDPLRIRINSQDNLDKNSDIMIDQIRAIDNKRLIKGPLLQCDKNFMMKIESAINDSLGLNYAFSE